MRGNTADQAICIQKTRGLMMGVVRRSDAAAAAAAAAGMMTWRVADARFVSLWRSAICAADTMHSRCVGASRPGPGRSVNARSRAGLFAKSSEINSAMRVLRFSQSRTSISESAMRACKRHCLISSILSSLKSLHKLCSLSHITVVCDLFVLTRQSVMDAFLLSTSVLDNFYSPSNGRYKLIS